MAEHSHMTTHSIRESIILKTVNEPIRHFTQHVSRSGKIQQTAKCDQYVWYLIPDYRNLICRNTLPVVTVARSYWLVGDCSVFWPCCWLYESIRPLIRSTQIFSLNPLNSPVYSDSALDPVRVPGLSWDKTNNHRKHAGITWCCGQSHPTETRCSIQSEHWSL